MLCLRSLAVLQVLYLQLRQLVSLHCEACLENPFQRGSGIQNPARVSKTNLMRLLLCSVVVTALLRGHGNETVIPLVMWSFVGLRLSDLILFTQIVYVIVAVGPS